MHRRLYIDDRSALEALGAAIRSARHQAGLTQRGLEALSGVDQTAISRMERGRSPGMRLLNLARIAAVLGPRLVVPPAAGPWV